MRPPNILLLCPDEMKASALGCYGQIQPTSPFIDSLAGRAVFFDQCHTVHPKCVPSRAALLTAQYPHVNGHRTLHLHVRPHEINLVRELRRAGYQTALVGKNHVVDQATLPETFDVWLRDNGARDLETPASIPFPPGSYQVGLEPRPLADYIDADATTQALDWLKRGRDPAKPFFMWLNWNAPHPPYGVPAPYYGRLDRASIELPPRDSGRHKPPYQRQLQETYGLDRMTDEHWRELIATYLEMTAFVDGETRRVFDALAAGGELDNTIVLFWSDHGDFAGEHQLPEKWDTSFYDCITRVPAFIHAPGRLAAKRVAALVESIDLLPTVLTLAGVPVPAGVQGQNLLPLIEGRVEKVRDFVFCQGGQEPALLALTVAPGAKERPCRAYQLKQEALWRQPDINRRAKMIRDRRHKYIYHLGGFEELYDLVADPWELTNLAPDPAQADLLQQYRRHMIEKLVEVDTCEPYQDFLES